MVFHASTGRGFALACLCALSLGASAGDDVHYIKFRGSSVELYPFLLGVSDSHHSELDLGLDARSRYRDMTLLGSVRPEFRTIERGILSLDFSYFERLAPETRPFFLEGAHYYGPAYLAPERIATWDAAAKLFGPLDGKTQVGVLDTVEFSERNIFVGALSHNVDEHGRVFASFKNFEDKELVNQFFAFGGDYTLGPVRLQGGFRSTRDNKFGAGDSYFGQAAYDHNGVYGRVSATQTTPGFFDRLGYYTETDVKGVDATAGIHRTFGSGSVRSLFAGAFTSQYRFLSNQPYRDYDGGTASVGLSNGVTLAATGTVGRFLDFDDRLLELTATSRSGRRGRIGVDFTSGELAGSHYTNALLFASYMPNRRVLIDGSFQAASHFANQTQTILRASYDLGRRQSLSGRLVQFQNAWNFYVRYSVARRNGELQLLFGDPNAVKFRPALIAKLIVPFEIDFK